MSPTSSVGHKWLEDFVALARARSFGKAAMTRQVTPLQFSRRIRALELRLIKRSCGGAGTSAMPTSCSETAA